MRVCVLWYPVVVVVVVGLRVTLGEVRVLKHNNHKKQERRSKKQACVLWYPVVVVVAWRPVVGMRGTLGGVLCVEECVVWGMRGACACACCGTQLLLLVYE